MKRRGVRKYILAFAVYLFAAQCCVATASPGYQTGESIVIRYQGQAVASTEELPADAQLLVSCTLEVNLGELAAGTTKTITLPEPLIAAGEGSFAVMARDSMGNVLSAGHASIGLDKKSVTVFLLASSIPNTLPEPAASETNAMPQQVPSIGDRLTVAFDVPCVVEPQSLLQTPSVETRNAPALPAPPASPTTLGPLPAPFASEVPLENAVTISGELYKKVGSVSHLVQPGEVLLETDSLFLRYNFSISDTQFAPSTQYIIPLPEGLKWRGNTTDSRIMASLLGGEEKQFAELTVDASAGIAYLVFVGDYWDEYVTVSDAYIEWSCGLNMADILGAESYQIDILGGGTVTVKVGENQPTMDMLTKAVNYENDLFTWTITYTPGSTTTITRPVTLVDTFDNTKQVFVPGSVTVDGVSVALAPVDSGTTSTIAYVVPDTSPAGTPIVLEYQTALADAELMPGGTASNTAVSNSVALMDASDAATGINASKSYTVSGNDKKWIAKDGVLSGDGRSITWTVIVKTFGRNLDDLTLYDSFQTGLTLQTGSIRVNGAPLTPAIGTLDTSPTEAPAASFALRFAKPYSSVYTITYTTKVGDDYFDNSNVGVNFTNNAWLDYTWHSYSGSGPDIAFTPPTVGKHMDVNTHVLVKGGSYIRATHEITWTLTINPYGVNIESGTITDDLRSLGLTYSGTFTSDKPALVTLDSSTTTGSKIIKINVGALGTRKAEVTFTTTVDDPLDYGYNTPAKTYTNTAAFSGTILETTTNNPLTVSDTAAKGVDVSSEVISKTAAGYNYTTNEVTWRVKVNQNNMPMTNAVVVDTLPAGQTFVSDVVTRISGSAATFITSLNAPDNNTLTITWATLDQEVVIEYKTKVDVDSIADFKNASAIQVSNSAVLKRDGYNPTNAVSANQAITNKTLDKKGVYDDGSRAITYTVNINPNKIDLDGCEVSDVIPDGLQLDIDSVTLWNASVNNASPPVFTRGAQVTDPGFSADYVAGTKTLTVSFPAGNKSYVLTYDCYVKDYSKGPFQNNIAFNGVTFGGAVSSAGANVDVSGGGGAGSGGNPKAASLTITKVDSADPSVKLAGVEFELYSVEGGVEKLIMDGVTDANGKATFNPLSLNKDYRLKETRSVAGYDSPMVVIPGGTDVPLETYIINYATKGEQTLTITNSIVNAGVSFTKADDAGFLLAGVKFELRDQNNSANVWNATSGSDGKVEFLNVPYGVYDLTETDTIDHHDLCTDAFVVEVKASGAVEITNTTQNKLVQGTIENVAHKGSVTLYMFVEGTNQPLAGALFNIVNKYGVIVDKKTTDAAGKIVFDNLAVGETYTVVEAQQRSGYVSTPDQSIALAGNAPDLIVDWPKTPIPAASSGSSSSSGSGSRWSGVVISFRDPVTKGHEVVAVEDKKVSPPQTSWQ